MQRRERWRTAGVLLLAVLLAHAGLALLLPTGHGGAPAAAPPLRPRAAALTVRMLPSPVRLARPPPTAAQLPPQRPAPARRPARPSVAVPSTATDAPAAGLSHHITEAAPAVAAAASAPPPRPLMLDLPRGPAAPWHSRALDDPRSNSPQPSVESRIGGVTGDGRWTQEVLNDGRRRYRRGTDCTIVQPARAGELFPFNNSNYTPPPTAGRC